MRLVVHLTRRERTAFSGTVCCWLRGVQYDPLVINGKLQCQIRRADGQHAVSVGCYIVISWIPSLSVHAAEACGQPKQSAEGTPFHYKTSKPSLVWVTVGDDDRDTARKHCSWKDNHAALCRITGRCGGSQLPKH